MATIYVDSSAVGGGTGADWTNAYTTLQVALTAWTTSDVIWVAHNHSETLTQDFTAGNSSATNVCPIFSVNSGTDTYEKATAAQIIFDADRDAANNDYLMFYGVYFDCAGFDFYQLLSGGFILVDCPLENVDKLGASEISRVFHAKNCEWVNSNVDTHVHGHSGTLCLIAPHGDFSTRRSVGILHGQARGEIVGGDFSSDTSSDPFFDASGSGSCTSSTLNIYGTRLPQNADITDGDATNSPSQCGYLRISGSDQYYAFANPRGETLADTGVFYDSGWLDEEDGNRLSYKITALSVCTEHDHTNSGWLQGPYVSTTGSKTITIEATENFSTALQNDEAWVEVLYPSTSGSPALTGFATTQTYTDIQTQADLTASTASWTNGLTRTVKFEVPVTFANAGAFLWRLCLGKYEGGGEQLNFDPEAVVS